MSEWKTYKLGEIAEITSSKRIFLADYVKEGIPFYRSKEVIERFNKNEVSTELFIEKLKFEEIKKKFGAPKVNDILLTSVGTIGIPFLVLENDEFYFKDGNLTWFRNYTGQIVPKYLFYWIQSSIGKEAINKTKIGSTQQALTIASLKKIEIKVPDLTTQTQIAQILTSLDDKIELNLQMNQTLEAMAQAIFKEWFVNFNFPGFDGALVDGLPKGWRRGKLGEVSNLIAGGDKPKEFSETESEQFNVPIYSNGISNEGLYGYTLKPRILNESITVSARGTIGFVCLRFKPYVPIVRLISVIPNNEILTAKYLYFWFLTQNISGTGTTQQQLTVPDFSRFEVLIPSLDVVNKFTSIVDTLFFKIQENKSQIQTLTQTRDTLLPKLMSGSLNLDLLD